MKTYDLSNVKVYVGTYGKYNNGSLFGAWLDLSNYSDKEEFYEACRISQRPISIMKNLLAIYSCVTTILKMGLSLGNKK